MKYSALSFFALSMTAGLVAAQSCDTNKYCAYTYNNNNCAITTWACDSCDVVVFNECTSDSTCGGGSCVNNLCCHADKLANGSADCPTTSDLQACGGFVRQVGTGGAAAWVPPYTAIPDNLKCGC